MSSTSMVGKILRKVCLNREVVLSAGVSTSRTLVANFVYIAPLTSSAHVMNCSSFILSTSPKP